MPALSDQTSIWEEDDESEMKNPRRNLFTSSPKQPSSEESKMSSKDSAISSITPTELKFSSPESDINSMVKNVDDQSQLLVNDDNSTIKSPFRRRRFKAIYPGKRMNASYRKRRRANPGSPTHLVIESVDDQLYTVASFQCICLGNRGSQSGTRNDHPELHTKLRQEAIQEVQTARNHVQESFQEEFQQERTTTEATTTTEGGHSRDD